MSGVSTDLLVEIGVMVVMMVVVMVAYDHHDLRLRRIRCCEAEDESESKQNLFHSLQYDALRGSLPSCSDRYVLRPRA
jgi:hypothetical protein